MGAVVALDTLFNGGQVWKGRPAPPSISPQPTGHAALDAALPSGGWPETSSSGRKETAPTASRVA